jgi:hypothetical protein
MKYFWPYKIFVILIIFLTTTSLAFKLITGTSVFGTKSSNTAVLGAHKNRRVRTIIPPTSTTTPKPVLTATPTKSLPLTISPAVKNSTSVNKVSWGAFTGWTSVQAADFEKKVGHSMNLVSTFVHWGNENQFPQDLADFALAGNKTLVIYWEAMDYNNPAVDNNPRYSYDEILNGGWDMYIKSFSASVKAYKGKVIIIPFEEPNGNWYPWSASKNNNSIAKYKSAFSYLHKFFAGSTNVKFAWDVNSDSVPNTPENAIANYYPGNNLVDYVGVNGFNFDNPWQSFDEIFGSTLNLLSTYQKPVYIFSMACAQGANKANWITDALNVQMKKYPLLAGWIWFSENKEKNWLVWSDNNSLTAFTNNLP